MLKLGMNKLWPTEVYLGKIENNQVLDNLCQSIFLNMDLDRPANDFQGFDILKDGPEEMQIFRDQVVWPAFFNYFNSIGIDLTQFDDRTLRSWIAGTRNGYMIPAHNHSGASFSAVFYLMCEETESGGELVLLDPRTNSNRGYRDQFKHLFENKQLLPSSGEYIIFPSFLYHHTVPFLGKLRLAMPVDLFL